MRRFISAFALLLLVAVSQVTAQSFPILLSPSKQELTAQPGSVAEAAITLQNNTNTLQTVSVSARDFEAGPEMSGEPRMLESPNQTYGISNWFTDSNLDKKLTVPGRQKITYTAKFRVPSNAAARTYFGAVIFSGTTSEGQQASVGSLVFITVGNPATELSVPDMTFGESDDAAKKHGEFSVVVNNAGQGLSKPTLRLKITGTSGRTIVELEPESSGSILPDSSRVFTFVPSSELPNEDMTATVSVVDQQGNTADKSIQLAHDLPEASAAAEKTPEKSAPIVPILIGGLILLLGIIAGSTLWITRRKQPQILTPAQTTNPQNPQSGTDSTDSPNLSS